jgi:hypothetical protein
MSHSSQRRRPHLSGSRRWARQTGGGRCVGGLSQQYLDSEQAHEPVIWSCCLRLLPLRSCTTANCCLIMRACQQGSAMQRPTSHHCCTNTESAVVAAAALNAAPVLHLRWMRGHGCRCQSCSSWASLLQQHLQTCTHCARHKG